MELINNTITITFPDNDESEITEANIVSESMRLRQSICDEAYLKFGGCIASEFSIDVMNTNERQFSVSLAEKWISVKIAQQYATDDPLLPSASLYPSSSLFPGMTTQTVDRYVFSGIIDNAVVSKTDNNVITLTAYDILAQMHGTDATDDLYALYQGRIHAGGTLTIHDILSAVCCRFSLTLSGESILAHNLVYRSGGTTRNRITYYPIHLNTDWMNTTDQISYGQLLRDACEMLGVFGRIKPNSGKGQLEFKTLNGTVEEYLFYEPPLNAEWFDSTGYTDFVFPVENANDRPGKTVTAIGGLSDAYDGATDKPYDFSSNILTQQKYAQSGGSRTSTEFDYLINTSVIGTRLALNADSEDFPNACAFSVFRPLKVKLDGRFDVDVGTPIRIYSIKTNPDGSYVYEDGEIVREEIETYLFTRTLTGIKALTDEIETKGMR